MSGGKFYQLIKKKIQIKDCVNKHNTTWKVFCTVFTHSLFLYQKSHLRQQLVRKLKYRTRAL